ncbi:MAG: hypothetical protein IJC27_00055 [Lentisphaeria bacterium]|nr:hypothetical protein [Lentisphaeria bacterium]
MKKSLLVLGALLTLSAYAAPKFTISGPKKDVVEKDGVYIVTPTTKTRVQLVAEKKIPVYFNAEIEIIAEVSGAGNIELGAHMYDKTATWKNGISSKMIRVDAEETETVKRTLKIEKEGIALVLPYISVHSGTVKVESLAMSVKGGLTADTLADAPKLANWEYVSYSRAMKCAEADGGVSILTGKGQLTEFSSKQLASKDGDQYKFSGEFTGKGSLSFGLHMYNNRRVWQGTVWGQVKLNGKSGELPTLTVKTIKGKQPTVFVTPVFRVNSASDISCKNVSVEKVK